MDLLFSPHNVLYTSHMMTKVKSSSLWYLFSTILTIWKLKIMDMTKR